MELEKLVSTLLELLVKFTSFVWFPVPHTILSKLPYSRQAKDPMEELNIETQVECVLSVAMRI